MAIPSNLQFYCFCFRSTGSIPLEESHTVAWLYIPPLAGQRVFPPSQPYMVTGVTVNPRHTKSCFLGVWQKAISVHFMNNAHPL